MPQSAPAVLRANETEDVAVATPLLAKTPQNLQQNGDVVTHLQHQLRDVKLLCFSASRASSNQRGLHRPWVVDIIAQICFLFCVGLYTVAQLVYIMPWVQVKVLGVIEAWWSWSGYGPNGDFEMVRPSYFALSCVVPLFLSLLLYEFLRDAKHNPHRIVAAYLLKISAVLRRKPRIFRWVCYFGYGELLLQTFLFGGNILIFWWGYIYMRTFLPLAGDPYTFNTVLEICGIVFGYNCVFNMAFLFIPATRNCAWMEFFSISYANGVKYHRWLGVLTLVTGVLHAMPFYWLWARLGTLWDNSVPCFDCPLDYQHRGYPVWFNVFGEISLIFLLIVGFTSIPWVRRKMFETFYYVHHLYIPGVIFAVMHWVTIIWWILPTLILYLISRTTSSWNALVPVSVEELTLLPDGIIKIVITRSSRDEGSFQVGQFVYLNMPAISKLQWHPFTIGSSPRTSETSLTILLKALGDWTEELITYTEECQKTNTQPIVYMDGYYGTSLEDYEEYPTLCLIGGGIGVTPLFAILEDIVVKLVHNRQELRQRIFFIFSFRELPLLAEIHPVLMVLRELDPQGRYFTFHFSLTRLASENTLNQLIDQHHQTRETGLANGSSTHLHHKVKTNKKIIAPEPFTEPLRGKRSRVVVYTVMLVSSTWVILWLEYGGGRLLDHGKATQYWPLENFVEIMVLFILPLFVYAMLFAERLAKSKTTTASVSEMKDYATISQQAASIASLNSQFTNDIHTYRDLISEYNVSVGSRPDMNILLKKVYESHHQQQSHETLAEHESIRSTRVMSETIGVFISGPEALKSAVEYAVADLGASDFDIHEEEFEL